MTVEKVTVEKATVEKATVDNGDSACPKPVQKANLVSAESAMQELW
jgi:hypothetical protein